jgi:hypothetical protein
MKRYVVGDTTSTFNPIEEIWKNKNGYMYGRTSTGDLFIGYKYNLEFYKDTLENRARLKDEWDFNEQFA